MVTKYSICNTPIRLHINNIDIVIHICIQALGPRGIYTIMISQESNKKLFDSGLDAA